MTHDPSSSPYVGLRPFEEKDSEFFCGRETEISIIATNIQSESVTILYGASGVGKSSLLQAGVIPELKHQEENSDPIYIREWNEPEKVAALLEQMTSLAGAASDQIKSPRRFLLLDQFEEYLLYHRDDSTVGKAIDTALARLVNRREVDSNVLIGLRDDGLSELDLRFNLRIPGLLNNTLQVSHLSENSARAAITEPLRKLTKLRRDQYCIESELVDEVLKAADRSLPTATSTPETDPLRNSAAKEIEAVYLQLILKRLWKEEFKPLADGEVRNPPWTLRASTLKSIGGAETIVETHVNDVMKGLKSRKRQYIAARFLPQLITPSGRKIAQSRTDLIQFGKAPKKEIQAVLDYLSAGNEARILRRLNASDMYELFHDVLASPVLEWLSQLQRRRLMWKWFRYSAMSVAVIAIGVSAWFLYRRQVEKDNIAMAQVLEENQAIRAGEYAAQRTAEAAAAKARGDMVRYETLLAQAQQAQSAAQQAQTTASALRSPNQPQSVADLAGQQIRLTTQVSDLQAKLNAALNENEQLKKPAAPGLSPPTVSPAGGTPTLTSPGAGETHSNPRANPGDSKSPTNTTSEPHAANPTSSSPPVSISIDSACTPWVDPFELYERKVGDILIGNSEDVRVLVYAADIHRFSNHPTGNKNQLYVLIFNRGNPHFYDADPDLGKDPSSAGQHLIKEASSYVQLTYVDSGRVQFVADGDHFRLDVLKRNDRLGSGRESITFSICKQ